MTGVQITVTKMRSPNCPTMTLQDALERGRKVYAKEHTHPAGRTVIAEDLGYSGVSGASASVIGALRQYGILQGRGDDMRISDDAVAVYELPGDDGDSIVAKRRMAFTPLLFHELQEQYADRLPGDGNLRHTLIKKGFLPETADEVIRTYRDNLQFIGTCSPEYNREDEDEGGENNMTPATEGNVPISRNSPPMADAASRTPVGNEIPVAKDCVMGVNASGRVTQQGIEKLIQYLGLIKDSFPTESERT